MGWLGATKDATYMIEKSTPSPKHCKAIASQKSSGLSYLGSIAPKPNSICIVRRLLNNLNAVNANAIIATKSIEVTGIGGLAAIATDPSPYRSSIDPAKR